MNFSQIEFRQKLFQNKVRRLLEAIEPDLNSFSRLMDLFLTAGGELRESSLSAVSRVVNEKKEQEIRRVRFEIIQLTEDINELTVAIQDAQDEGRKQEDRAKKTAKQNEKKTKQVERERLRGNLYSQTAQNTIFRAAFARLEECAEQMGLPTAKNGFAGAKFGTSNKIPTVASATPIKRSYAPSAPPKGPITTSAPAVTAPATTPSAPGTPVVTTTKPGKKAKVTRLPSGKPVPTKQVDPNAQPAITPPAATPEVNPTTVNPPIEAKPEVAKPQVAQPQAVSSKPWALVQEYGSKLSSQEAKQYLSSLHKWLLSVQIPKASPSQQKGVSWLIQEYEKNILEEVRSGLGRADSSFSKPEYKAEMDPGMFAPVAFKAAVEKMIASNANDKKLIADKKNMFGQFELDMEATRLREYLDTKVWPIFSAEMNRLADASTKFFTSTDISSIVETVKEMEKAGTDLNAGFSGIADSLGVPVDAIAGAALLIANSFDPAVNEAVEPVQEPTQEPGQPTTSSQPASAEDFLEITKNLMGVTANGKKPLEGEALRNFFKPLIDRNVAVLGNADPNAVLDKIYYGFEPAKKQSSMRPELGVKPENVANAMEQFGALMSYDRQWAIQAVQNSVPAANKEAPIPGEPIPEAPVPEEVPISQAPIPVDSTPGPELTPDDYFRFVKSSGLNDVEAFRPVIRAFVASKPNLDQNSAAFVVDAVTSGISSTWMKDRTIKTVVRKIGDFMNDNRDKLLSMAIEEVKARMSGTSEPSMMPSAEPPETSSGPQDLSALVAQAKAALEALGTAGPEQFSQMRKKTPDVIAMEISQLQAILKKDGLSAFLNAVSKYLTK